MQVTSVSTLRHFHLMAHENRKANLWSFSYRELQVSIVEAETWMQFKRDTSSWSRSIHLTVATIAIVLRVLHLLADANPEAPSRPTVRKLGTAGTDGGC